MSDTDVQATGDDGEYSAETLDAFLAVEPFAAPRKEVYVRRLDANVTIEAVLDTRLYDRLRHQCTKRVKIRGRWEDDEVDFRRFSRLIVANWCVWPPLRKGRGTQEDAAWAKLCELHKTEEPDVLVSRVFLMGEVELVADEIMTLSGFDDEGVSPGN